MKGVIFFFFAVLIVFQLTVKPSEAVVTCNQVNGALASCLTYLTKGGPPSSQCCAGVRNLNSMTTTRPDRQAACNCLKQTSARYPTIRDDMAVSLPRNARFKSTSRFHETPIATRFLKSWMERDEKKAAILLPHFESTN